MQERCGGFLAKHRPLAKSPCILQKLCTGVMSCKSFPRFHATNSGGASLQAGSCITSIFATERSTIGMGFSFTACHRQQQMLNFLTPAHFRAK